MTSASTPAVPTPMQSVPLPHEIAVKGSDVCAKFLSACHDPGGLAADAGVWAGTVSVERAPAPMPATTARQAAPQRNRCARPNPRRSRAAREPRSMAITPGEEVQLTPFATRTRPYCLRSYPAPTPTRWGPGWKRRSEPCGAVHGREVLPCALRACPSSTGRCAPRGARWPAPTGRVLRRVAPESARPRIPPSRSKPRHGPTCPTRSWTARNLS